MTLTPFGRSFEPLVMFTKSVFLNQWMEFNQTCIDYGYMILTSQRDDEVLLIWTLFDFFRPILIDCINISKFENNDTSRWECTGGGFKGVVGDIFFFFSGKPILVINTCSFTLTYTHFQTLCHQVLQLLSKVRKTVCYTTFANLNTKHFLLSKVYSDEGGIK